MNRWVCSYCLGHRLGESCEGCGAARSLSVPAEEASEYITLEHFDSDSGVRVRSDTVVIGKRPRQYGDDFDVLPLTMFTPALPTRPQTAVQLVTYQTPKPKKRWF